MYTQITVTIPAMVVITTFPLLAITTSTPTANPTPEPQEPKSPPNANSVQRNVGVTVMALDPNDPSNFVKMNKWNYFDLIGYKPHPRQKLFHDSTARFKVPICGRRFGKSVMAARELTPNLFLPNRRYWIVGPTYDLGEKEFRIIWNDLIIKLGLGRQREIKRSYSKKQGDLSIEFPWGTKLEVRSADRPDNLVGEGLHGVIMSEAAKHTQETWDRFIRPSLTDYRGSALFPTTPEGQNWVYELWKMGRNPEFPEFESWQFPSWDNPIIYPLGQEDPEILLTKKTTPEEEFLQEYGADFTNFSGKIYKEWDEATHVQEVKFIPGLPNYIAFDWGYTAPMAAVEFQIDTLGRVRVWREHYKSHTRLRDYLYELRNRTQPDGYHLDLCFGDAANPEAVVTVSEDFCPCYADPRSKSGTYGGTTSSGWMEGIELVKGCLKLQETDQDEYGTPIEQPWLIVDHKCVNLIREFNNYRSISAVRGKDPREAAHASDDHALDALRYGLMHYFKLGATASLSSVIDTATMMMDLPDGGYFTSGKNFA